jgi:isopenicillin N synthase-like dioxygenase
VIPYSAPRAITEIPVIDMACLRDGPPRALAETAVAVRRACLDTGFFYVRNHGMPASLSESALRWSARFFDLPLHEKLELAQSRSWARRGYEAPGAQVLDAGSAPDLKESFRCGIQVDPEHPYARRKLSTYGPSQWPPNLPGFQRAMEAYADAVRQAADQVLELIALSLELERDFFRAYYRCPMQTVRLLRYPPQPADRGDNLLGAGAHTDWGGITMLLQDSTGGLEVRNVAGEWVKASPIEGTFVVNLGELLARWSNGLYQSNMHRVRNGSSNVQRHSIAFFYDPDHDAMIECIPSCLAPGAAPSYEPCTAGEHIVQMHEATKSKSTAA